VEILSNFFDTSGFMPHGHCFLWTPALLWTFVISDSIIVASYYSIPVALWYFANKRPDIPFRGIYMLFGVFVMACGTTHLMATWNIWHTDYWVDAGVKVITAISSGATAILLFYLMPKALTIPSIAQLEHANQELRKEVLLRKAAEQELQKMNSLLEKQANQLKAINQELETFTYSVSHDLKAPLRGIDGYSRLLQEDHAAGLSPEGQIFIANIRHGAQQMSQLIEDLLAYSRLERRPLQTVRITPGSVANAVVAEFAEEIHRRHVTVSVNIPYLEVSADVDGLAMILRNLLENALKFTRDAPQPMIEIGGREEAENCTLWVRDNGIGFDMKFQERIFEIFQRLQRAEDYPGTGIGLAIVRKAAQRMEGRVWAESTPGAGAAFYLELPK
jgi:signal transduction histidine kinase